MADVHALGRPAADSQGLEARRAEILAREQVEPDVGRQPHQPAILSLADTLCAAGCGANIPPESSFTTVELKANFLGSAQVGQRVVGVATPVHLGRRTHVWDVEVTNEATGKPMALFRCTQMVIERRAG